MERMNATEVNVFGGTIVGNLLATVSVSSSPQGWPRVLTECIIQMLRCLYRPDL
jgi:hypothetical protein